MHESDAGDEACRGAFVVVEPGRGERGDLEEGAAVVEELVDAVAGKQLAARDVTLP